VCRRSWKRQTTFAVLRALSQATFQRCMGAVGIISYAHCFRSFRKAVLLMWKNIVLRLGSAEEASPMRQDQHGRGFNGMMRPVPAAVFDLPT